jgi:hypothetical protein
MHFDYFKQNDKKEVRINIRISKKQDNFIKKNNLSPTKIFDNALNQLIIKGVK